MKKVIIYSLVVVAAVVLIMWKLNSNKKYNQERTDIVKESTSGAVPVGVAKVTYADFGQEFSANGNFEAVKEIDFAAESAGRITEIYVKEGSVVHAGQALARIDNEVATADLTSAQVALKQAKLDMERYQKALASGGVSQKQADDARVQYEQAQAKYASSSKAASNTYLKSPINGVVNSKLIETGSYVAANTKLFQIVDISKLKLVVNVPESKVVLLQKGQDVTVTTNVFPEETYKGKISFIAVKGDKTLNYPVEIEVINEKEKELKAGMYGTAGFALPKQQPALLVSRSAFVGGLSSNTVYVYQDSTAKIRQVVSGRVLGDSEEVRSGLKEGETVITSGQVNLIDGTKVVPQK